MSRFDRFFPWFMAGLAILYAVSAGITPSPSAKTYDLYGFGKIAVQEGGRIQPIDSYARNSLLIINNSEQLLEANDRIRPAISWLLEVMARPRGDITGKANFIRIQNDQLLDLLRLEARPGSYRYSLVEVGAKFQEIRGAAMEARKIDHARRDPFQRAVLELEDHLGRLFSLSEGRSPGLIPQLDPDTKWTSLADAEQDIEDQVDRTEAAIEQTAKKSFLRELQSNPELQALPQEQLKDLAEQHFNRAKVAALDKLAQESYPHVHDFRACLAAYSIGDVEGFNRAVADYHAKNSASLPSEDQRRVSFESFFNHLSPFYLCGALYIMVTVVTCLGWLGWTGPMNRAAFAIALVTFALHTLALLGRMYIQGRPPVTNLYSSAVFIGWGCLGLCLVLEAIFRNGIPLAAGTILGFATMRIAYFLGSSGDTLEMLVAVLDTNLWLATHVVTVTLGYMATLVAGMIGIFYLIASVFTPSVGRAESKKYYQMIYGTICFATLLSLVGTVLGGIWADQSWGRFWGWDPKENGALLIVMWNALILHARWGGLVKLRGVAMLTIVGNMITAWSWFGTNQLGVGLHNYGFNSALALGCRWFWISMVVFIGIGAIPRQYWKSSGNA